MNEHVTFTELNHLIVHSSGAQVLCLATAHVRLEYQYTPYSYELLMHSDKLYAQSYGDEHVVEGLF